MSILARTALLAVVACVYLASATQDAHAQITVNIFSFDGNPTAGDVIFYQAQISGLKPRTKYRLDSALYEGTDATGELEGVEGYSFVTDDNGNASIDTDVPDADNLEWGLKAYNPKQNGKDFNYINWQIYDLVAKADIGPEVSAVLEVSPKK